MSDVRTRVLTVRLSEAEYEALFQAAVLDKRKISDYCRLVSLEHAEQDLIEAGVKPKPKKRSKAA